MEKQYDIVSLGELLIDFTDAGLSAQGMRLFERNAGGAPANVACCAAKIGRRTAFIGKVGKDMHGTFLKETLEANGVDTRGLCETDAAFTTLAFVALDEKGERSFSFARKPGADTQLAAKELDTELLASTKVLTVGSLSLTAEPARNATRQAVELAKKAGAWIAYDPNDRPALWDDREEAKKQMRSLLCSADILKVSEEEALLLTGHGLLGAATLALSDLGIPIVAVTRGEKGVLICVHGTLCEIAAFPVSVTDTTGAGDAFFGGFLTALTESGKALTDITAEEAADCARFGCAVAACSIQKRGAIPAMPTRAEAEEMMRRA